MTGVDQSVLDDLRDRLRGTRRVRLPAHLGWTKGADEDYVADLTAYWADTYEWRRHEARIDAWPWVTAAGMRLIHQRAADPEAPTVVLLHGWPDSVLRFERVLPLLTDLNVVVPALPGYPFAPPLTEPGMDTRRMAGMIGDALAELGHGRYVASGGDIGGAVAEHLALLRPDAVTALHLTDIPYSHMYTLGGDGGDLTEAERAYKAAAERWQLGEAAYALEQGTKPHTLAVGLGDSPAGLAAWIVEKLRSWSDCGGDVETAFPREDLLTWVTAYWVTNTIGTSFSPYTNRPAPLPRVDVPTVAQLFPHDLFTPPREYGERFLDIREWQIPAAGGHFGAWEQPEVYAAGVRTAVAI